MFLKRFSKGLIRVWWWCMMFWMTLDDIVDVNTYTSILKTSMGTIRDHPTNQFDLRLDLCEREKIYILFFTINFVNNNIYNFVYNILSSSLMAVYFSWEIPLRLRSSSSISPTLFRTSDRPAVSVSSSNQIMLTFRGRNLSPCPTFISLITCVKNPTHLPTTLKFSMTSQPNPRPTPLTNWLRSCCVPVLVFMLKG